MKFIVRLWEAGDDLRDLAELDPEQLSQAKRPGHDSAARMNASLTMAWARLGPRDRAGPARFGA